MELTVYGPLRSVTGDKRLALDFAGGTVREAIEAFVAAYPRAERHLYRADGTVAPSVRVAVDGESADLDDECPADAALSVHPAMRGG